LTNFFVIIGALIFLFFIKGNLIILSTFGTLFNWGP